jgi:hypothetical protein
MFEDTSNKEGGLGRYAKIDSESISSSSKQSVPSPLLSAVNSVFNIPDCPANLYFSVDGFCAGELFLSVYTFPFMVVISDQLATVQGLMHTTYQYLVPKNFMRFLLHLSLYIQHSLTFSKFCRINFIQK